VARQSRDSRRALSSIARSASPGPRGSDDPHRWLDRPRVPGDPVAKGLAGAR
jgi:hypothetical protein